MPVTLKIRRPRHGQIFVGDQAEVTFEGEEVARDPMSEGERMYYRWYSAHHATAAQYSLHAEALRRPDQQLIRRLCVGSHAIAFAAMNQASDRRDVFEQVTDGGVTGGTSGSGACVVHVVRAKLFGVMEFAGDDEPLGGAVLDPLAGLIQPGATIVAVADGPIMWSDFEPGFAGLRYRYSLAGDSEDAPPPYVFDAVFALGEQSDARLGRGMSDHPQSVAWSVLVIPDLSEPDHWRRPADPAHEAPVGFDQHPYDQLVVEVWHTDRPESVDRDVLQIALIRPTVP